MMPGPLLLSRLPAEEHAELRQHRDRTGNGRGDRHQQSVVMLDMRELVRNHAGELLAAELVHQTGGDGDRGVFRIAAGGERVGLDLIHHEHARHRQAGTARKLGDEADQLRRGRTIDFMGAVHRQHHAVGVPVGEEVGCGGNDERDHGARGASDQIADAHEQGGQASEQHCGTKIVHGRLLGRPRANLWPAPSKYECGRRLQGSCVVEPQTPAAPASLSAATKA
ncbi:hypothetical protein ABIA09_003146 [Bradyrhizobium yuanmingense]